MLWRKLSMHSYGYTRTARKRCTRASRLAEATQKCTRRMLSVPAECRLSILSMPAGVSGRELADFLTGAVLASAGHREAAQNPTEVPCFACGIRTTESGVSEVVVSFRTELAASVAFKLHGLSFRGVPLVIRRPADFGVGASSDPSARLQFNAISLDDLLGPPPRVNWLMRILC